MKHSIPIQDAIGFSLAGFHWKRTRIYNGKSTIPTVPLVDGNHAGASFLVVRIRPME